jgi:hypothetical protein
MRDEEYGSDAEGLCAIMLNVGEFKEEERPE